MHAYMHMHISIKISVGNWDEKKWREINRD